LIKYYGGGLPLSEINRMGRRELFFWRDIYERQVTEEEIVNEILNPPKGKPGVLPGPAEMRRRVDARITERRRRR
jgi:hypothetical protein